MMADPATGKPGRLANHPDVIAIQRKIDDIKEQLRTGIKDQFCGRTAAVHSWHKRTSRRARLHQNAFDRWLPVQG